MDKPPDEKRGHDQMIVDLMTDIYRTTQDADIGGVFVVIVGRNLDAGDGKKSTTWLHVNATNCVMPFLLERAGAFVSYIEEEVEKPEAAKPTVN